MKTYALIDAGSTTTRHTRIDYSDNRFVEYDIQTYPSSIKPVSFLDQGFVLNGQGYRVEQELPFLDTTNTDVVRKYSELGKLQIGKVLNDFGFSSNKQTKVTYAVASNLKASDRLKIKKALIGTYHLKGIGTFEFSKDDLDVVTQGGATKFIFTHQAKRGVYYDVGMFTTDVATRYHYEAYPYNARGILLRVGGITNNAFSRAGFTYTFNHLHETSAVKKETTGYLKSETQKFINKRLAPIHMETVADIEEDPYDYPMIIGGGFGALLLLHKVDGLKVFNGTGKLEIQDGRFQVINGLVKRVIEEEYKLGRV
jgi:hypothetical protein